MITYGSSVHNIFFSIGIIFEAFLYTFLSQGVFYFNLLRFWIVYYNCKLEDSTQNDSWRKIISPVNVSNWYLLNKSKYGNRIWVMKRLVAVYVGLSSADAILLSLSKLMPNIITFEHFVIVDSIIYFAPMVIAIVIWRKTPQFKDNVLIHGKLTLIYINDLFTVYFLYFFGLAVCFSVCP